MYSIVGIRSPTESLTCVDYQYSAVQCVGEERCFCVTTDTGIALSYSYTPRDHISCANTTQTACLKHLHDTCKEETYLLADNCSSTSTVPKCEMTSGSYLPKQCGSGSCYCVDVETGEELPYSHGRAGYFNCSVHGRITQDQRTVCQVRADRRCDAKYHDSLPPPCHVLECDDEGAFRDVQCYEGQCACVNVTNGAVISYVDMSVDKNFTCTVAGEVVYQNLTECQLEELTLCPKKYYESLDLYLRTLECALPHCSLDGTYYTERCEGRACRCADKITGLDIPNTAHSSGHLRCDEEGNLVEDERTACEKQRSLSCEPQYVSDMLYIPHDCPALLCTESGLYNPLQCDSTSCWCVEVHSGAEYPRTRSTQMGTFDCDYRGNPIDIASGNKEAACRTQHEFSCDQKGEFYEVYQCTEDYCFCVYIDSGGVIWGSEVVIGLPRCEVLLDTRPPCQHQYENRCTRVFEGGELVLRKGCLDMSSSCDGEGNYLTEKCTGDVCVCVDKSSGEKIPNTVFEIGTHYCREDGVPVYIAPCDRQSVLACTAQGRFESVQCTGGTCYCVFSDSGDTVFGTTTRATELTCETVDDTRGPCTKYHDTVCATGQCSVLSCDVQGLYQSLQCLRGDVCFCVNPVTGAIVSNSVVSHTEAECSTAGEIVVVEGVSCEKQEQLECSSSGRYFPKQCVSRFCYCVFVDTGLEIPRTRTFDKQAECVARYDTRTHCQRRRDKHCQYQVDFVSEQFVVSCDTIPCSEEGEYGAQDCEKDFSERFCTNGGYYQPLQCAGDICYCVNIYTGYAYPSTVKQDTGFFCSLDGTQITKTPCQNQTLYSCDTEGNFNPVQQGEGNQGNQGNQGYSCIYIDNGKINYHDTECRGVFDLRTTCQITRDERCPFRLEKTSYVPDPSCETVTCDPVTGHFAAQQCFKSGCYCVDRESGVLGDKPESTDTEFTCTDEGRLVLLTRCRKQRLCLQEESSARGVVNVTSLSRGSECNALACTPDGLFAAKQHVDDLFFCVYMDSGEIIQETKSLSDEFECSEINDTRTGCELNYDLQCPTELDNSGRFSRPEGCVALQCAEETGLYVPQQCDLQNTCWCVSPLTGESTAPFSAPRHTFVCDSAGVVRLLTLCQQQADLVCTGEGDFQSEQCSEEGRCVCVYSDTGAALHNTAIIPPPAACPVITDNRTHCQANLDKVCPVEATSLSRGVVNVTSLSRGVVNVTSLSRGSDCNALSCTPEGLYRPQHCVNNTTCVCVNVTTGALLAGTEGFYDTFLCTETGETLPLTPCRRQDILSCDEQGHFRATQCSNQGSNQGYCRCVYIDTGYEIADVGSVEVGGECPGRYDDRTECERRADVGCDNGSEGECFVPDCDQQGNYETKQCSGAVCFCVTPDTGVETPNSRQRADTFWCDETGTARDITICKSQSTLQCDKKGNFAPTQCNSEFCFCVFFDTGDVMEDTESILRPACPESRENRSSCQIARYKECPKYIRPGTNAITKVLGCPPEGCRENGQFYPMGCEEGRCWCRDVNTGTRLLGSLGLLDTFHCSEDGKQIRYSVCEQRRVSVCGREFDLDANEWKIDAGCMEYECQEDGTFVQQQCIDTYCWCVYKETGVEVPGAVGSSCSLRCYPNGTHDIVSCDVGPSTACQLQDLYECDHAGNFFPYQLLADIPVCVYTDNGRYVPFSEFKMAGQQCPFIEDNRGNCMVERFEGCSKTYNSTTLRFEYPADCFRPTCTSDERYEGRQCFEGVCWCVDQDTGSRLPATTGVPYQVTCHTQPKNCMEQYQLRCEGRLYTAAQCFDRFCACVYVDTGLFIWNSLSKDVAECTELHDTRRPCEKARELSCLQFYFDIDGTFSTLPECKFDKICDPEGNFRKLECYGETCACINPADGEMLLETQGSRGTFTCNEQGEKIPIISREKTKCELQGIEQCTPAGWYPTPDCSHGVCYCVYADSGHPIYGTEVSGSLPDCNEKFDDRSVCEKYNEAACPHVYAQGSILRAEECGERLECGENGLFLPNQCYDNSYCFCVNVTTGEVLPNVFGDKGRFVCDESGNVEMLPTEPPTLCQSQNLLTCDDAGSFYPRQCTNPVCFCVYADSGRVLANTYATILEASEMDCQYLLDERSACETRRDEVCKPTFNYETFSFDEPTECFPPRCRGDGTFRTMQCYSLYECVCVDPHTGDLLNGSAAPIGELVCGEEVCGEGAGCSCLDDRGRYIARLPKPPCHTRLTGLSCSEKRKNQHKVGSKYIVQCNQDEAHKYSLRQCYLDRECWCVDPYTGAVKQDSVGPADTVQCKYDPPCVSQQKQEISLTQSYEGFYPVSMYSVVQCEEDGSYYPRQCDIRKKECWCVDEFGVEIKGSRALPWIGDVTCVVIKPPNPAQRKPKPKVQCPSNRPSVFCARNTCRSSSCPANPTAKCLNYKCRTCAALYYDPKTYHPVSCLYTRLSCHYAGTDYRHGEEFEMGCSLTCYCYQGGLRCRARCLLRTRPACPEPVIIQDPTDPCCKVYACRDRSFLNSSLPILDDLERKRRLRRNLVTKLLGENWG